MEIKPEVRWDPLALCGSLQWDRWFMGVGLTHWALPLAIQIHHQQCGHADGWQVLFLCIAIGYGFDDCQVCD